MSFIFISISIIWWYSTDDGYGYGNGRGDGDGDGDGLSNGRLLNDNDSKLLKHAAVATIYVIRVPVWHHCCLRMITTMPTMLLPMRNSNHSHTIMVIIWYVFRVSECVCWSKQLLAWVWKLFSKIGRLN